MLFTLADDFKTLDWHVHGRQKPDLTDQEAMIVAVANMAAALENIALQLNQALDPLQTIANDLHERHD